MNIDGNILDALPSTADAAEQFTPILAGGIFRVERIVSLGHASPPGFWYEQVDHEWVMVVSGSAGLEFEGEGVRELKAGDYVHIPAGRRHRVAWTAADVATVWLAIHYRVE